MPRIAKYVNDVGGVLLGKSYYQALVRWKVATKPGSPLLVWQMGKVGSKAIWQALKMASYPGSLFHIHVLSEAMIARGEARRRAARRRTKEFLYGQCIREALLEARRTNVTQWNIVSLIREPVGRNISAFFQNLDVYFGSDEVAALGVDMLIERFMKEFDHDRPLDWFDAEIKAITGIDVLDTGFDRERGYQIYEQGPFRLLVLRMDDIRTAGRAAIKAFLDMDVGDIGSTNTGESKAYSDIYRMVRNSIRLDDAYLARMYESRYSRTFYTEEELETFMRRWKRPASSSATS